MSVSNYDIEKKYRIGNLKPHIYLVDKDTPVSYTIDNGAAIVNSIDEGLVYKIEGLSVSMSSEETIEGRFKFNNKVSITLKENTLTGLGEVLQIIREGLWKVVVEDKDKNLFIMNLDFNANLNYDYVFTDEPTTPNQCTLEFEVNSNFPTLKVNQFKTNITTLLHNPCEYMHGRVKSFMLSEYDLAYIIRDDNLFSGVYVTGSTPFKVIRFLPNTFSYRERFDGDKFNNTITFTIPLSDYQSYWQYNLIEFTKNKYVALFSTSAGNTIASGFDYGYFPSYTITTSDEDSTLNTITITLSSISYKPFAYNHMENPDDAINKDDNTVRKPVDSFTHNGEVISTINCVSTTQAAYTLLQETTTTGVDLDRWWALEGWEDYYRNTYGINIVGTYTLDDDFGFPLVFDDYSCYLATACEFIQTPPKIINFTKNDNSLDFYIQSTCNWNITLPDWLELVLYGTSIAITSGSADISYHVTLRIKNGTEGDRSQILYVNTLTLQYLFTVNYQDYSVPTEGECSWYERIDNDEITAQGGSVVRYNILDYYYEVFGINTNKLTIEYNPYGAKFNKLTPKSFSITVPENTDAEERDVFIIVGFEGTNCTITIHQGRMYYNRVLETGYICDGRNEYQKYSVYYGYTPTEVNKFLRYEMGDLIRLNSENCVNISTRWVNTDEYMCVGANKYVMQKQQMAYSDDPNNWIDTDITKAGELIEEFSPECDSSYFWQDDGGFICVGNEKYASQTKYHRLSDTEIESTGQKRQGELLEYNSMDCITKYDSEATFVFEQTKDGVQIIEFDVIGSGSFQVDWNDGTEKETYRNECTVRHAFYADDTSNEDIRVTFEGYVRVISVKASTSLTNQTTELKDMILDKAVALEELYVFRDVTDESLANITKRDCQMSANVWNFDHCYDLLKLYIYNIDCPSLEVTMPYEHNLSEITIIDHPEKNCHPFKNSDDFRTYFLNKLSVDRPYDNPCIINVCPLTYEENQVTCGITEIFETKTGWYLNNECCEQDGSKRYRYVDTSRTICLGYDKHYVSQLQMSEYFNGGWSDWKNVDGVTGIGSLIERESSSCGFVPPIVIVYEWRDNPTDYICEDFNSYRYREEWVSQDDGRTWSKTGNKEKTEIILEHDEKCGWDSDSFIERWVEMEYDFICEDENAINPDNTVIEGQFLRQWTDVRPRYYLNGSPIDLYEANNNSTEVDDYNSVTGDFKINNKGIITDMSHMFNEMATFNDITQTVHQSLFVVTKMYNCSSVKSFKEMFMNSGELFDRFDPDVNGTMYPTDLDSMFAGCQYMDYCNMSSFNNRSLYKYNSIWMGCTLLETLDLSGWQFYYGRTTWDRSLFRGCRDLKTIIITGATDETVAILNQMLADSGKNNVNIVR